MLNAADPGTLCDNTDAATALADFPRLTLLDTPIRRRTAFANALGLGLSIEELPPATPSLARNLPSSFPWCLMMKVIVKYLKVR